jgi:hypothetical protein
MIPQCFSCKHFDGKSYSPTEEATSGANCAAFPDGIPISVWTNEIGHGVPLPGDHGIRYEYQYPGSDGA